MPLWSKGFAPRNRRIYKIWVEGKSPDVVIETTSRKTRRKDTADKPQLYARLGVKEYFLFDPHQEYLDPPLQGHRLVGGGYEQIEPDEAGALVSQELGMRLSIGEGHLQFVRLDTGQRLLTREDAPTVKRKPASVKRKPAQREAEARQREAEARQREAEARQREAERADREAQARLAAEAEVARLRAELARRGPPAQ